ncbi:hypothetical protein BIY27_15470 [Gibbsiella quercinecans]|uniref:cellulose biosynthesis protein BcsO n=1 Tax=Gibbsiella quercinecans TaxID=929813 RepID=UPI000EF23B99|nr:cellulose biosynthesis protein BcsO [Gibbsiella quercinecans]RLM09575.1 hypothetical protein BIY27_15470 [Gibbsiella quercinecans]
MNKYDDIKRFIEKTKVEGIDYKEINERVVEEDLATSMKKWSLIKQISAIEEDSDPPFGKGMTTQSVPQPVSAEEFANAARQARKQAETAAAAPHVPKATSAPAIDSFSSEVPPPVPGSRLMDSLHAVLPPQSAPPVALEDENPVLQAASITPGHQQNLLDSLNQFLPPGQQDVAPAAAPSLLEKAPLTAPVAATPPPAAADSGFRQMFKQKAPQQAAALLPRDTPLQPLLEMIALCR